MEQKKKRGKIIIIMTQNYYRISINSNMKSIWSNRIVPIFIFLFLFFYFYFILPTLLWVDVLVLSTWNWGLIEIIFESIKQWKKEKVICHFLEEWESQWREENCNKKKLLSLSASLMSHYNPKQCVQYLFCYLWFLFTMSK